MEVVSVSVLSTLGRPDRCMIVVFTGLPLRGREGSWYLTKEVEDELVT
jgi:hypothetical protein